MPGPSTELFNSRRRFDKVSYTPLVLPEAREGEGGDALPIAATVEMLQLQPSEAAAALGSAEAEDVREALDALRTLAAADGPGARLEAAARLARIPEAPLVDAVQLIGHGRERAIEDVVAALTRFVQRYLDARPEPGERPPDAIAEQLAAVEKQILNLGAELGISAAALRSGRPNDAGDVATMVARPQVQRLALTKTIFEAAAEPATSVATSASAVARASATFALPDVLQTHLDTKLAPHLAAAIDFIGTAEPDALRDLLALGAPVLPPMLRPDVYTFLGAGLPFLAAQVVAAGKVAELLIRRKLQPLGLLHLEQLVMTPLDVQRGELVYTLPLSPGEKVTLSHKEWSVREEEYASFVEDYFENYSEEGAAEKTDIALASRTESEHGNALAMSKPVNAKGATLTEPVDTTTSADSTHEKSSLETSRRHSRETTRRASALSIRDQKISFTVATVSGTEDFTSRLLVNDNKNRVMLVDYFRRMRKWRTELFRTGVRLTYDVVLPDPGKRLRARWLEIKTIDERLAKPFVFELEGGQSRLFLALPFAPGVSFFDPSPRALGDAWSDLEELARGYGTTISAPPETKKIVETVQTFDAATGKSMLTLPLPQGYQATRVFVGALVNGDDTWVQIDYAGGGKVFSGWGSIEITNPKLARAGTITVAVIFGNGPNGAMSLLAECAPTEATWLAWRTESWSKLQRAALARDLEEKDRLRQRRAALLRELEAPDAVTLRRLEREQVMHLVLEWLFPDFAESGDLYRAAEQGQAGSWQPAMEYGEYVKFVHDAIDWDRVLMLLYPYFWDHRDHHADKLLLHHPDPVHREFLRAGAARVVIAIRPGFEEEVVSLLDQGELGKLAPGSRFSSVIKQVRKANQHYAKLADADIHASMAKSTDKAPQPAGELVGSWIDWTPTAALDSEVTLRPVRNAK